MSTRLDTIFSEVALKAGDLLKTRHTNDSLLVYYNSVAREVASRVDSIRYRAYYDLQADDQYSWPDEMTRVVSIAVSDGPSDQYSYIDTKEMKEDEYRANTRLRYPAATRPTHYWPTSTIFHLWPRPNLFIARGGRIDYFGLPDDITDWTNALMPFPDFMRNWIVEGMLCEVLFADKQFAEATQKWALWMSKENEYKERIEDRSEDARSQIRVKSDIIGVRDQV